MVRTTRPLTNTEVLRAKALEKDLTLHDGGGLFLIVKTSGKSSDVSVINVRRQSSDKNEVRRTYNRSIYLQKRVELMEWRGTEIKKKF